MATTTSKKTAIFPDEVYLNTAIREGRAVKKELSLKAIGTPDVRLQQRVKTDVNHVRLLEGILRDGDQLRPIIVFEDENGKYHVADGFHRHGAHVNFGASSIWAWVIPGSWRDAMIYSTMCNRNLCLKRTAEDIKKAVFTLLDDEEWRRKSDSSIAKHCGVGATTAGKYRAEHSVAYNVPIPETVETSGGRLQKYRTSGRNARPSIYGGSIGGKGFRASIGGTDVYLGRDRETAESALDAIVEEKSKQKQCLVPSDLRFFFQKRNLMFTPRECNGRLGLGGVSTGHGVIFVPEPFDRDSKGRRSNAVAVAVGRVLLARQLIDPTARAVVVCYVEDAPPELIEAGRSLGVEFLTPDELVASLSGPTQSHSS